MKFHILTTLSIVLFLFVLGSVYSSCKADGLNYPKSVIITAALWPKQASTVGLLPAYFAATTDLVLTFNSEPQKKGNHTAGLILSHASHNFELQAPGLRSVEITLDNSLYFSPTNKLSVGTGALIDPQTKKFLKKGVVYKLVPLNSGDVTWVSNNIQVKS